MAILESRTKTGISWVKESIALFQKQPAQWIMLSIVYVSLFMMLPALPGLGVLGILTILAWPVFTAFAVLLFRNVEYQKKETLTKVFGHIKPVLAVLVALGLSCLIYATLMSYWLEGDLQALVNMAQKNTTMTEDQMTQISERLLPFMLKLLLLLLPLFMATWFSPMLIVINRYPLLKAIKSSIAGVLQYTIALGIAYAVISAGIFGSMLLVGMVIGLFSQWVPMLAQLLMPLLLFGALLTATALMFAFQYVCYRDIFRAAPVHL